MLYSATEIHQVLATCTYEFLFTMLNLETYNSCELETSECDIFQNLLLNCLWRKHTGKRQWRINIYINQTLLYIAKQFLISEDCVRNYKLNED